MDGPHFGHFLYTLLEKHQDIYKNFHKYVFIMDNVKFHHAISIKEITQSLDILFLPAYCPFLNPIEEFIGLTKRFYRVIKFE